MVGLTDALVEEWTRTAISHLSDDEERAERTRQIEQRLGRLKTEGATTDEDTKVTIFWNEAVEDSRKNETEFPRRLAEQLGNIGCSADGAPCVARGLYRNHRFFAIGQHFQVIADRMQKAGCPGVEGFTEEDWRSIRSLAPASSSSATPEP